MVHRGRPVQRCSLVGSRGVGSRSRDVRSRGVGSRGVGRLGISGIGRLTGVHNIGDVAAVGVSDLVVDGLQTTVGERHGVGAGGGVAVPLLAGVELGAVVIVHGVVVGVDGGLVVGGRGGVAVPGCVIGGGDGGQSKNNEDLRE